MDVLNIFPFATEASQIGALLNAAAKELEHSVQASMWRGVANHKWTWAYLIGVAKRANPYLAIKARAAEQNSMVLSHHSLC